MQKINGKWLENPTAQALLMGLERAGFEGYFVGGCVRDALLGRPVGDIDISTSAHPDQVMKIAGSLGLKSVPTGIEHGTVTLIGGAEPLEVTTFRKDVETDGRRAVVAFSERLEDDAARRDFRINAIYADANGALRDPMNGLGDIDRRRLVFVGDAAARIREDYLRIVRLYRFAAQLGFGAEGISSDASDAAARLSYGLEQVSAERKTAELFKLLAAPEPCEVLNRMAHDGVLARLIPGANVPVLSRFIELEQAPEYLARLAALTINGSLQGLRLSKSEQRSVVDIKTHARSGEALSELAYRKGAKIALAAARLRSALSGSGLSKTAEQDARQAEAQVFPIKAQDLPDLKGPKLGEALKRLEAIWVSSEFELSKKDLLTRL